MTPEARKNNPPSSPMQEAAHMRSRLSQALYDEQWYSQTVSPKVGAFILGISPDILENTHMAVLFHQTPDGFTISAGTTRQTAMEAFREWNTASDPRSKNTFARDAYMSLYRVFQAAAESAGDVAFAEVAEFFVTALAEQDDSWVPFLERVKGYGDIAGDEDARIIGEKMDDLWKKIPPGMRSELASYSPRRLFNT